MSSTVVICRLFGSLPKFVRGCDHVVRFFQHQVPHSKATEKKSKGSKREEKTNKTQFKDDICQGEKIIDCPHKIAEAVREQSLCKDSVQRIDSGPAQLSTKLHDGNAKVAEKQQEKQSNCTSAKKEKKGCVDENSNQISICTSSGRNHSCYGTKVDFLLSTSD